VLQYLLWGSIMARNTPAGVTIAVHATWQCGPYALDLSEMRRILRSVADARSILAACSTLGITYRTLWGRLELYATALGHPVVDKSPGQGTQLTATGRALLAALESHAPQLQGPDAQRAQALADSLQAALGGAQAPLRFFASHDMAIARCVSAHALQGIEVHYLGSADCTRALARGEAELAGFHHAPRVGGEDDAPLRAVLEPPQFWVIPLMEREQGIMILPGNPLRIKGLTDLAKPGVRFVNRQRGSGTRMLLDQLLQAQGLRGEGIVGYDQEEFTHQAVAAMISARAADAGLGLRAAAAQFKLDFVPLSKEIYYLAGRPEYQHSAAVTRLIERVKVQAAQLAGYVAL
jgi:putative molybdopterin biosynthesis protein